MVPLRVKPFVLSVRRQPVLPQELEGACEAAQIGNMAEDEAHVVQRLTQLMRVGVPYDQVFFHGYRTDTVDELAIKRFYQYFP